MTIILTPSGLIRFVGVRFLFFSMTLRVSGFWQSKQPIDPFVQAVPKVSITLICVAGER